jgi:hypothetical protein
LEEKLFKRPVVVSSNTLSDLLVVRRRLGLRTASSFCYCCKVLLLLLHHAFKRFAVTGEEEKET